MQTNCRNEKIDKRPDFLHRPEILKHDILATKKSVYATLSNCLPRRRRVLQQLNRRWLPSDYMKRNHNAISVAGRAMRSLRSLGPPTMTLKSGGNLLSERPGT